MVFGIFSILGYRFAPRFADLGASLAATEQRLTTLRQLAAKHTTVHLAMPDFHPDTGRSSHP